MKMQSATIAEQQAGCEDHNRRWLDARSGRPISVGCACAAGPIFSVPLDTDGMPLHFELAYPRAPKWIIRIAFLLRSAQ